MPSTPRWALPYPASSDSPDGPTQIGALATALDDVAKDDQGLLSARPVSTPGSPGKKGRYFYATDTGIVYRDTGTSWIEINPKHKVIDMIKVRLNAAHLVFTGSSTPIEMNVQDRQVGSSLSWSSSFEPWRVNILENGLYLMVGNLRWPAVAGGRRFLQIGAGDGVTGYGADEQPASNVTTTQHNVSAVEFLAAGSKVTLYAFQDSGGSVNTAVTNYSPSLIIVKLGL